MKKLYLSILLLSLFSIYACNHSNSDTNFTDTINVGDGSKFLTTSSNDIGWIINNELLNNNTYNIYNAIPNYVNCGIDFYIISLKENDNISINVRYHYRGSNYNFADKMEIVENDDKNYKQVLWDCSVSDETYSSKRHTSTSNSYVTESNHKDVTDEQVTTLLEILNNYKNISFYLIDSDGIGKNCMHSIQSDTKTAIKNTLELYNKLKNMSLEERNSYIKNL